MNERSVPGQMAGERTRGSELLMREFLETGQVSAKPSGANLSDGALAEEKVENESEIGQERRDENPCEGRSRGMTRQHDAQDDADDDAELNKRGKRAEGDDRVERSHGRG